MKRLLPLLLLLAACAPFSAQRAATPVPPTAPAVPTATARPTRAALATPIPIVAPTPTSVPLAEALDSDAEFAALAAAQRLPRDQVQLARELGTCRADPTACPSVARTSPLEVQVGDRQSFFVLNSNDDRNFEVNAELRYVGPIVLMYVDENLRYDQAALEQAARTFEQEIYPRTRALFGSEQQPGVDGDTRITVLTARDLGGGVLGYYAARDSLPKSVNRYSNEREMFLMNGAALPFDQPSYLDVLAHEFQHMIHRNVQPNTSTWFNEGNSTLSQDLNGYIDQGYAYSYLARPDTQLNAWTDQPGGTIPHYGAAHLFMRYMFAQYASESELIGLIRANAGNNLEAFTALAAQRRADIADFATLFGDWAVANLIDDPSVGDGRFTYVTGHGLELLPQTAVPSELAVGQTSGDVTQFGVDYLELPVGITQLEFDGGDTVPLVGGLPQGTYAWWSNRSDNSVATLTRAFDLRAVDSATLEFSTWYEIESEYDFAFVSVSTDGGTTWLTLPGAATTNEDPHGHNYGNGYTGISGSTARTGQGVRGNWIDERIDLTPYAGVEILLRFWHITDEGFNAPGMLLDNIRIPEIGYTDDVENGSGGWSAAGFVRSDGSLAQRWQLRLVRTLSDGRVLAETVPVDSAGRAVVQLASAERGVLVVTATTPFSTERAQYTIVTR
ncbi:hypothetical protein HC891_02090 [Candidatus Gracilibacteria bacterium]|nr:hypothetical protein [Candidatus Gracilibacteria bacterium]